jgi:hypothetical protein
MLGLQGADREWRGEAEIMPVRGATCPNLSHPPEIDGHVGRSEWDGATSLNGFVTPEDAQPAARATTVLLAHDASSLYVAFLCQGQTQPQAQVRHHDGDVWVDDCVELFVQPPGSEAYYHFAVNALGSTMESRCAPSESFAWNAPWEAKVGRLPDGWSVEIAIPFTSLEAKPEGFWRMNFGREEADTKSPSCWNPTGNGFHVSTAFGEIMFKS